MTASREARELPAGQRAGTLRSVFPDRTQRRKFVAGARHEIRFYRALIKGAEDPQSHSFTRNRLSAISRQPRRLGRAILNPKFDLPMLIDGYWLNGEHVRPEYVRRLAASIRDRTARPDELKRLAAAASECLEAVGSVRRGRPLDLPEALLIRQLAAHFKRITGREASSGGWAHFTQLMSRILPAIDIHVGDSGSPQATIDAWRQKIKAALKARI